ncbi:MAG: tetracycline resistance MFS efflux pump [Meiothermus sp.]|nr:MAG: tetracycline resistance MFS efflux pump [Meiothermus sp.]
MERSGLILVLVILFVDIAGESLVYPVIPDLLETISGGSPQQAASLYGWSLAIYAALTLFFAPVWGVLSDRYGRRPMLLLSMVGAMVGNLVTALATSLELYFLGRIIAGATSANMVVINAYLVDVSPPDQRARNFGWIGAIAGIGFVAGPALGGLVGNLGLRAPFWIVAGLSALTFLIALFGLRESLRAEHRRAVRWLEANPFSALAALLRYPLVRSLAWAAMFNGFALSILVAVWIPYCTYRYGFGVTENGFTLALYGLTTVVGQVLVVPWLVPRLGERRVILLGLSVSLASFVAYGLASAPWILLVVLAVSSLGAVDEPALQSFISQNVCDEEQGTVQGALSTLNSLMGVVGPVVGTHLFSRFSGVGVGLELPGAPFFAGALAVGIGLVLAYRVLSRTTG